MTPGSSSWFDGSSGTIPGGYPFTTQIEDPDELDRRLNIEIKNGRSAMLGVFGRHVPLTIR